MVKWLPKRLPKRDIKRIYKTMIPEINGIARASGYGLAVHGSMTRDLDLVLVPWVKRAVKPETLRDRIIKGVMPTPPKKYMEEYYLDFARKIWRKPHGRIGYCIHIGPYHWLDLSITPRSKR